MKTISKIARLLTFAGLIIIIGSFTGHGFTGSYIIDDIIGGFLTGIGCTMNWGEDTK